MNNYFIYKLISAILDKDRQGALTYDEYNTYLRSESRNYFDYHYKYYEINQRSTDALSSFKKEATLTIDSSGQATYPTDYAHWGGWNNAESLRIDIVNDREYHDRQKSYITQPTIMHPIASFRSDHIKFLPTTIDDVDIYYLKYPKDAVLDGYIDADDNFVYLEEDETKTLAADQEALDGTSDESYTSKTVEMEWKDEDKLEIASRILFNLGISYGKQALLQYSQKIQTEDQ